MSVPLTDMISSPSFSTPLAAAPFLIPATAWGEYPPSSPSPPPPPPSSLVRLKKPQLPWIPPRACDGA